MNTGQTPIHMAFIKQNEAEVNQLLNDSKLNVADENGLSHLHIACAMGHLDSIKRYLRNGANINCCMGSSFNWLRRCTEISVRAGSTPLHVAVVFGRKDVIKYLLDNNVDVHAQDSLGFTPIHVAMKSGYDVESKCIPNMLFNAIPNLHDSVSSVGLSYVHVAAWANDSDSLDKLLLNGANIEQVIDVDVKQVSFLSAYAGRTALLIAMSHCACEIVESLLKAGANVYAKDHDLNFPLLYAMNNMHDGTSKPFIEMLKNKKYDVESCGMTALHIACANCDIEWAKRLLNEVADVNARISDYNFEGATPLFKLIDEGCLHDFANDHEFFDLAKLLLDNGADVKLECRGKTPIHIFYEDNTFNDFEGIDLDNGVFLGQTANLLLKSIKSYDVNPGNHQGFSHFHLACVMNDVVTATKFLDHGVDVNAPIVYTAYCNAGFTPLHFAMAHKSKEVAYLLLKRGANVNAQDSKGNTPFHIALKKDFIDLSNIETMKRRGAMSM